MQRVQALIHIQHTTFVLPEQKIPCAFLTSHGIRVMEVMLISTHFISNVQRSLQFCPCRQQYTELLATDVILYQNIYIRRAVWQVYISEYNNISTWRILNILKSNIRLLFFCDSISFGITTHIRQLLRRSVVVLSRKEYSNILETIGSAWTRGKLRYFRKSLCQM